MWFSWFTRIALPALVLLPASESEAGAWPRGKGEMFLGVETTLTLDRDSQAFSGCPSPSILAQDAYFADADPATREITYELPAESPWAHCSIIVDYWGRMRVYEAAASPLRTYSSVFFEYGASERLTLGVDAGHNRYDDSWAALGFARYSFASDGPQVWAVELAAGPVRMWDGAYGVALRPALHWGRGTDWGWLSASSYAVWESRRDGIAYKLDLTLGWDWTEKTDAILQVQTSDYLQADPVVRLAPSVVRQVAEGRSVEIGLVADVTGRNHVGISVGSWLEF